MLALSRVLSLGCLLTLALSTTYTLAEDPLLIGYYTNWAHYRAEPAYFPPERIDASLYTHLCYAFAGFNSKYQIYPTDKQDTVEMYDRFHTHVRGQNPLIKTLISLGGWKFNSDRATKNLFSAMATSTTARQIFAANVVKFARRHGFDGIDIDWEYPAHAPQGGRPDDKRYYVEMLQAVRNEIVTDAATRNADPLLLSVAIAAGDSILRAGYDLPNIHPLVDWIGSISYDYAGSWSGKTGMHTRLDAVQGQDSMRSTMNYYLWQGVPKTKIVVGFGAYGVGWTLPSSFVEADVGDFVSGPSRQGPYTHEPGQLSYLELLAYVRAGARVQFDSSTSSMYLQYGDQWIGYDNPATMRIKASYARDSGFLGAMIWSIDQDDITKNFPLTRAIRNTLHNEPLDTTTTPSTTTTKPAGDGGSNGGGIDISQANCANILCGNIHPVCNCDTECATYGDCCYDYTQVCEAKKGSSSSSVMSQESHLVVLTSAILSAIFVLV